MNLSELNDLQESSEDVWGEPRLSFEIETRSEDGRELVHRKYTFSRAKEWDKWMFHEFEEKKTENTRRITARNWRRTRHIIWKDSEAPTVPVPPEVTEKLKEMMHLDKLVLQTPGPLTND